MKAGFGCRCITPDIGTRMEGFFHLKGAEAIHDDLHVRALVLTEQGVTCLILAYDLLFFERSQVIEIKSDLAGRFGLHADFILVNTSHTHAGPRLSRWHYTGTPEAGLFENIRTMTAEAVGDALNQQTGADMSCTMGTTRIPVSRRKPDGKGGVIWAPDPAGEVCEALPVCMIRKKDGTLLSLLFSVSCHPSIVHGHTISAEFPGVAVRDLNKQLQTEGCIFLQGTGGDCKPCQIALSDGTWAEGDWLDVELTGTRLADEVMACIESGLDPVLPQFAAIRQNLRCRLAASPTREFLQQERSHADPDRGRRAWAEEMLNRLERDGALPSEVDVECHVLKLGANCFLAGLEGEAVSALGNLIIAAFDPGVVFPLGYTNGTKLYLPTTPMLQEGGYEVDSYWEYHQPAPLAEGGERPLALFLAEFNTNIKHPGA